MIAWIIAIFIALVGAVAGHFFKFLVVVFITVGVWIFFIYEGRKGKPTNGTSGHMGGMIIGFFMFLLLTVPTILTSIFTNREMLMGYIEIVFQFFRDLLLR